MTKISSAKQQRRAARPAEDEDSRPRRVPVMSYENDVLHVFGTPLQAHEEFPWLMSANSLLKAVVNYRISVGDDPKEVEKFRKNSSPRKWTAEKARYTGKWSSTLRAAGRTVKESKCTPNHTFKTLAEYALQTKLGKYGGTFLCHSLIVDYCRSLDEDFAAAVNDFFLRGLRGEESVIKEVKSNRAKNTATREESKDHWPEWIEWHKAHGSNSPSTLGEIYPVVLGKTKREYMADKGIGEPFRDNMDEADLRTTTTAQALTMQEGSRVNAQGQPQVGAVARSAARMAVLLRDNGLEAVLAKL